MRHCFIHIGTHKTGSSSIQSTWFSNRDILKEKFNLHYSSQAKNHVYVQNLFLSDWTGSVAWRTQNVSEAEYDINTQRVRENFTQELKDSAPHDFVLSAEGFSFLKENEIADLKTYLDEYFDAYTILVYVRHPFSYVSSLTQQILKGGVTFENIIDGTIYDLDKPESERSYNVASKFRFIIEKYQNCFGPENVIIREFDRAKLAQNDVVHDFAETLFPKLGIMEAIDPIRQNDSMSHEAVLLLEAINRKHPLIEGRPNPERARNLIPNLTTLDTGHKFQFSDLDIKAYAQIVREDVDWLSETTGGAIQFDLSEPPRLENKTSAESILDMCAELTNKLAMSEYNAVTMNRFFHLIQVLRKTGSFNEPVFANILNRCRLTSDFIVIINTLSQEGRFHEARATAQKGLHLFPKDEILKQGLEDLKEKEDRRKLRAENQKQKEDKLKLRAEKQKQKEDKLKLRAENLKQKEGKLKLRAEKQKQKEDKRKLRTENLKQKKSKLKLRAERLKQKEDKLKRRTENLKQKEGKLKLRAENQKQKVNKLKQRANILIAKSNEKL